MTDISKINREIMMCDEYITSSKNMAINSKKKNDSDIDFDKWINVCVSHTKKKYFMQRLLLPENVSDSQLILEDSIRYELKKEIQETIDKLNYNNEIHDGYEDLVQNELQKKFDLLKSKK
jgi:hypothetical protein